MIDQNFLTDEELEELCPEPPSFDLDAVTCRVLARVISETAEKAPGAKKAHPVWKGLLLSAVICILSVSCLAVADLASGGRISAALGIAPKPVAESPAAVQEDSSPAPAQIPVPEPEPEEEATPAGADLGREFTDTFAFTPVQTALLRPAAQNIQQTAIHEDIKMTVLQTLGDSQDLYITVRFDFPESVPVDTTYCFQNMDFSVNGEPVHGMSSHVVACSAHSVTYLLSAKSKHPLNGQRVTLSYENYGRNQSLPEETATAVYLPAGGTSSIKIDASGTTSGTVTLEQATITMGTGESGTAAPAERSREDFPEEGFTIVRWSDGSSTATYDGTKGERWLCIGEGTPTPMTLCTQNPTFETLCAGTWEQSWTLSYQDLSKSWCGAQSIYDPALILSSLCISPLSWKMECTGTLDANDPDAAIPYVRDIEVELVMADGSSQKLPLHLSGWSSHTEDDGTYRVTTETAFSSPVDLTNAVAVILDGVTLPFME